MMVEVTRNNKWKFQLMFLGLATILVFAKLVPLQTTPSSWAAPDLLICLCFAWVIRRPDYMPALLIAAVMLITDMLYLRPPGLMAALFVLGAEFLRNRARSLREQPFSVEWVLVAGVLVAILVGNRLILTTLVVSRPSLGLSVTQLITTLAAYPLVALFTHYALGIRKIASGEVDAMGHKL